MPLVLKADAVEKRGNVAATLQMDWPFRFRYGGGRSSRSDFAVHGRFAGLLTQAAVVADFVSCVVASQHLALAPGLCLDDYGQRKPWQPPEGLT